MRLIGVLVCLKSRTNVEALEIKDAYDLMSAVVFMNPRAGKSKKRRLKARYSPNPYTRKYFFHIRSKKWMDFKKEIIRIRGRKCEQCGAKKFRLHLHHLSYKNLGKEKAGDVKLLCVPCHEKVHGRAIG